MPAARRRSRSAASSNVSRKRAKRTVRGSCTTCASVAAANDANASSLTPRAPWGAVGEGLGDVRLLDRLGACESRRRAGDSRHTRAPPSRERQSLHGAVEQLVRGPRSPGQLGPEALARLDDACAHGCGRLRLRGGQLLGARPRNRHDEVEPVEQRPRKLVAERGQPLRRARALRRRIAAAGTGTEIHRRHELEASREDGLAGRSGDRDRAVLERLTQRLECRSLELRQLVEKQHAAVGEAGFAGARPGAATDDRGRRRAVVWRAERRARHEWPLGCQEPRDRVDSRHLERLERDERRQDAGQPSAEHRLARTRWAGEQQVVPARSRELERTARPLLTTHVGQVGNGRSVLLDGRVDGRRTELAAEIRHRLRQVADGHRLDARERRLGSRLGRAEDAVEARPPCALGDRERAAHGPDAPVERELAHRCVLGEALARQLA